MLKQVITLLILSVSFDTLAYYCQPSNANNFDGYSDEALYNDFYLYNVNSNNYQAYQVVQNTPGSFQQEYWCIYKSIDEKVDHINSCDDRVGDRNTCPINIGGYINSVTNFSPYLDSLDQGNCSSGSNVCIDIAQTLGVSSNYSSYNNTHGYHIGSFNVFSNGWVDMKFKGLSYDINGNTSDLPLFYKPKVNITNGLTGKFDLLEAKYGVRVLNSDLLKRVNGDTTSPYSWKLGPDGGVSPVGTVEELVLPTNNSLSPGFKIGAFSPAISGNIIKGETSTSEVQIFAKHLHNPNAQSGKYYLNIQLIVTAHERL